MVLEVDDQAIRVACGQGDVVLSGITEICGGAVVLPALVAAGDVLAGPDGPSRDAIDAAMALAAKGERHWRSRLRDLVPAALPGAAGAPGETREIDLDLGRTGDDALRVAAGLVAALSEHGVADLAYGSAGSAAPGYVSGWVPMRYGDDFDVARRAPCFALDIQARDRAIGRIGMPVIRVVEWGPCRGHRDDRDAGTADL